MESDDKTYCADQKALQKERCELPAEAKTGITELGIRQQKNLEAILIRSFHPISALTPCLKSSTYLSMSVG